MEVASDVDVIKDLGIIHMAHRVAEWGYEYIEQSPCPQVNPFYKHPRASREIMAECKQALRDTGLELSSFIYVYRWSDLDELRRQAAVKNWKRLVEIAVETGVQVINIEFSSDPNQPETCGEMFCRSMEELLPTFEREGTRVEIQAHPWGFCEENNETVDIVRSLRSSNVEYAYNVPHTFFYGKGVGDVVSTLRCVGSDLSHVLIAGIRSHTKHCRYIVSPSGMDVVVYRHADVGEGDVNFDALSRTLCEMKFAEQTFKAGEEPTVAISLFGYPGEMKYQAVETRELIERELLRRQGIAAGALL